MDVFDFHGRNVPKLSPELEQLTYAVIGAAIEVHRELGPGLNEINYKRAMAHELRLRGIEHQTEVEIDVVYKGVIVGQSRIDLLVAHTLIVELKTVELLTEVHRSQALTYLRLKKLPLALLINFNVAILKDGIKRVINT
jgi:GxxExxY protein